MRFSRPRGWAKVLSILASAAVLPLGGCIAHAPGSGGGQKQIQVTVTTPLSSPLLPVSTTTTPSTVQVTAVVAGTSNTAVTWSLAAATISGSTTCTATGSGLGTITGTGDTVTYTAPSSLPMSPCGVAVIATSAADSSVSGQTAVNVHVVVSIDQQNDVIGQSANLAYTATVEGAPSGSGQDVTWSVSGSGGGAFDGSNPADANVFIAPQLTQGQSTATATVNATSTFDPAQAGMTMITVQKNDPIGTATNSTGISNLQTVTPCPADSNGGLANGTCYSMTVSCRDVADMTAYLKVNTVSSPVGTVVFVVGSGGNGLYDSYWNPGYGYKTVEMVNAANFNTVQVSFGAPFVTTQANGWLQGPGGVRRLACRYATIAQWVYSNPSQIGLASGSTTPYCATGNSAGAGAIAYATYEYGLDSIFTMIEPTGGPPMTRMDFGCVCTNQSGPKSTCSGATNLSMCYSTTDAEILDAAYEPQVAACSSNNSLNTNLFSSDSIIYAPGVTEPQNIPGPVVKMLMGANDNSAAVPQGETWYQNVTPMLSQTNNECAATAGHEIPEDQNGAVQIATDIIGSCIAPAKKAAKTNPTR